ncbi:hypothetical protein [Natronococcus occultus]|uniref:TFIIS-type domain-containing protein n=1 Tax=Natronococcus occultus SP4 TaxID=694430 RepID=L0JWP8_9EURY|nr:hypothetical protein [Natronococcus occultus]AGB37447.1 hypothetical protein Natoc_1642 [Natronococcus occultus SP4]
MDREIRASCPSCESGTAGEIEKHRDGAEVTATMTCGDCGNEWTRTLRRG